MSLQSVATQSSRSDDSDVPSIEPEVWKSLDHMGFSKYEVSSKGNVRHHVRKIPLSIRANVEGYCSVGMKHDDGRKPSKKVHILVINTFIGPKPSDLHSVDHIDRNPGNNSVKNLRWATLEEQSQNKLYAKTRQGRPVNQYDLDGNFIRRWETARCAESELGIHNSSISSACSGTYTTAGKYMWRYVDEVEILVDEIWKSVPYQEYTDAEVSNMGRVRTRRGYVLPGNTSKEYEDVGLTSMITHKSKYFKTHRLVMAAFSGINENLDVNHKDGNKLNNKLENLEYCTRSENIKHAHSAGLVHVNRIPVIKTIVESGEKIYYSSLDEAGGDPTNLTQSAIRKRCEGITKDNKKDGVSWNYAEEIPQNNLINTDKPKRLKLDIPAGNILHIHPDRVVDINSYAVIKTILDTGEQIHYPSMEAASRDPNNLSSRAIRARCDGLTQNNKGGISWVYADKNLVTQDRDKSSQSKVDNNQGVVKTILETGQEIFYPNSKIAAAEIGNLSYKAINNRCKGKTKDNIANGVSWRYADKNTLVVGHNKLTDYNRSGNTCHPVIKTILTTNQEIYYSSIKIAAACPDNLSETSIRDRCNGKTKDNTTGGVSWRYANENEVKIKQNNHRNKANSVIKTCISTGIETTYPSIEAADKDPDNMGKTAITKRCKGITKDNTAKDVHWRYADPELAAHYGVTALVRN